MYFLCRDLTKKDLHSLLQLSIKKEEIYFKAGKRRHDEIVFGCDLDNDLFRCM